MKSRSNDRFGLNIDIYLKGIPWIIAPLRRGDAGTAHCISHRNSNRYKHPPHHINQQGSVPPARRTRMSVPPPHGTSLRVGLIRLCAFSTSIGHYLFFLQFRLTNFDIRVKIFKRCTLFLQLLELRKGFLIPFTIILLYSFLVLQLH